MNLIRALLDKSVTNPLREGVRATWPAVKAVAGLSFFMNLLAFAPAIYMMTSYQMVLASRNLVTWAFLTLIFIVLAAAYAIMMNLRRRILVRVGVAFDQQVSPTLFVAVHRTMLGRGKEAATTTPVQAMRDLDTVRDNVSGKLVAAGVDLLFAPLFLLAAFLLHPLIGLATLAIMIAVATLGFLSNRGSGQWTLRGAAANIFASDFAAAMLRNSEVIHALGMVGALQAKWKRLRDASLGWQAMAADKGGFASVGLSFVTFGGGTLVLAVTLLLVIENLVSAGVLFGAMMLAARAIAPMASLSTNWSTSVTARYAFERIDRLFNALPAEPEVMSLPRPEGEIIFDDVTVFPPGSRRPVLRNVSFEVEPGDVLGVIGPSAAGKSSVARAMIGIWPVAGGAVRIDGSEITHWNPDELGRYIGYIPQDVELFAGSVAENIARFQAYVSEDVIEAARLAGVHELIQALPEGYNTQIGEGGAKLSGGQRQRIALARAVYGRPPIVILDEPNASLDQKGEESLVDAIRSLKRSGSTVVLITHRANIMSHVDKILVMTDGMAHLFGNREDVMRRLGMPSVLHLKSASGQAKA